MSRTKLYYTNNEITENLYTAGNEFETEDQVNYIGIYHRYTTGEIYTEKKWIPGVSKKLINRVDKITSIYTKLNPNLNLTYIPPTNHTVTITTSDIKAGFVERYFIMKYNEYRVIEINESQYKDWKSKKIDPVMYIAVKLLWYITGSKTDLLLDSGVTTKNKNQLEIAAKLMPQIKTYLTNLTQFYTDTDYITPKDINGLDS